jgi:hypothetical protein
VSAKQIYSGAPGTTWKNTTGKVQYQLLVQWKNSCGVCIQRDRQIGPLWPTPFHHGCRCKQKAIWPNGESLPFVDFRLKIAELDHAQQTRVVGRSNLTLIDAGVVQWSDVVTPTRIRTLREVVSRQKLGVAAMVAAGVKRFQAEHAFETVNTPAHVLAEEQKVSAFAKLRQLGLSDQQIRAEVAKRLAARVMIGGAPPPPASTPTATPPPAPAPVQHPRVYPRMEKPGGRQAIYPMPVSTPSPAVLPVAAAAAPRLSASDIQSLFGVKLKPAAAAKAPATFPTSPSGLVVVKQLGGSTGAELVKDPVDGRLYVRKKGKNADHLREEFNADQAYRALGVDVPDSKLYDTPSGPVKLSVYSPGKTLDDLLKSDPAAASKAIKKLQSNFVADALLGNWDVVGMNFDNILVSPRGGKVLRIDNGGALRYRAQGGLKGSQWSGTIGELASLRNASINPSAAKVFGSITDAEIRKQAKAILKRKQGLLDSLPDALKPVMEERLKHLEKVASQKPVKPTIAAFKKFNNDQPAMQAWGKATYGAWAKSLSKQQSDALGEYTGNGFRWMNPALRQGVPITAQQRKKIDALATALKAATLPEPIEVSRGVGRFSETGYPESAFVPGFEYPDAGFLSASLLETPPLGHGANFLIRLPQGAPGAYVNASSASSIPREREFLLPPGTRYRVIERTTINGMDTVVMEYIDGP